ncbi:hypothetical protein GCM10023194_47280 [Planotetraspora phitsanulokensis]|uniref:histidine kinase n=2 Tax=Planotetraspora phitsanulokensis TaxID=575192 RepID=A0A8J3UDE9_9ACTN|nr:hypothetical protein Pph01_81810 [Planotetraspora phitsanulokensis]
MDCEDREIDYRAVFKLLVLPALLLTPDFVVVAASDSFLKATGRSPADVLGRHLFTAFPCNPNLPHDPDVQGPLSLRASLERVIATGEPDDMPLQRFDIETNCSSGMFVERYWSTISTPILGPDGEVELIIHRTEEVTDFLQQLRRSGKRGVMEARPELEAIRKDVYVRAREVKACNENLKQTASALREAADRQRRFLLDASHDLRNPITGLLIELELAHSEPHIDLQSTLHRLQLDAERLNDIVADLLELARLDTALPAATERVDLAHLVTDELERRSLTVAVVTRLDEQVVVQASRTRLARLLGNLIDNAERHASTTIEIIVAADPPNAVIEVIDNGAGIAPADRERVFERHCRLDDARRRDPGGSGLGLAIAREIAIAYGGHLYVADHPTGARFVLRLPFAA